MQHISETKNGSKWPRQKVASIDARKKDLIIRISDWTRVKDATGYDVEVYVGGVYDWNESRCFGLALYGSLAVAKKAAVAFASEQIARLL